MLVSRKWSGKTLEDHGRDRKAWLIVTLGLEPPDPAQYTWEDAGERHGRVGVERGDGLDVAQRPSPRPGICSAAGGGFWVQVSDLSRMHSSPSTEIYGSLR